VELNKPAFQKDQFEIQSFSEEDINPDSVGADISAIDNGFSNMNRAFFKAAFANKEDLHSHNAEYGDDEKKDLQDQIWSELVEQMIERAREEVAARIIQFEGFLRDLREERARYESKGTEIAQSYKAKGQERDALTQQLDDLSEKRETILEERKEAEAQTELAASEQERCAVKANLTSCAATYAPEEKNLNTSELFELVNERTAQILEQSIANQSYVVQKLSDVDTQLVGINEQLQQVTKDMQDLREQAEQNAEKIRQLDLQRDKLEEDLRQAKQFEARMNDPEFKKKVENGEISQENLQTMLPDFMKKDAATPQQMVATASEQTVTPATATPTASISYLADARESRPTSSVSATLNDGGGIKASSMQSSFAMAASGLPSQESAPAAPAPIYEQNRQMAMSMGMS